MKILVLPGTYDCRNLGDVAMLQVAVTRLKRLWPAASIHVLTYQAAALKEFCPEAEPAPLRGRDSWLKAKILPRWFLPNAQAAFRRRSPGSFSRLWHMKAALLPPKYEPVKQFLRLLHEADLLLMAGCGLITDAFRTSALQVLDTFELAFRRGLPTAMVSQGIGPVEDPVLRECARAVLPRVGRICARDLHSTVPLLERLGVPASRLSFTGDDAVELAWRERREAPGNHLGANLRMAGYSGMDDQVLAAVRKLLAETARRYQAGVMGLPIARTGRDCDVQTLERLLTDLPEGGDPGKGLGTPLHVIRRISECRVVVTGSYHAAVFALAQGIPALGLVSSAYYEKKLTGLAGQFRGGCEVLRAEAPEFPAQFRQAVDRLWQQAPSLRLHLLREAERQVRLGLAAYAQLPSLLNDSPRPHVEGAHPIPVLTS